MHQGLITNTRTPPQASTRPNTARTDTHSSAFTSPRTPQTADTSTPAAAPPADNSTAQVSLAVKVGHFWRKRRSLLTRVHPQRTAHELGQHPHTHPAPGLGTRRVSPGYRGGGGGQRSEPFYVTKGRHCPEIGRGGGGPFSAWGGRACRHRHWSWRSAGTHNLCACLDQFAQGRRG